MTRRFEGAGAGTGVGRGEAYWLDTRSRTRSTAGPGTASPDAAWTRIEAARDVVLADLEAERSVVDGPSVGILRAHEAIIQDPALEAGMQDALESGGTGATTAVRVAIDEWIARFEAGSDRMAARADDLRDLQARLLDELDGSGREVLDAALEVPPGRVLLVDRLTPSLAARLDLDKTAGIVTGSGSRTAHATLIARASGVPIVVDVGDGLQAVDDGTQLRVDAARGLVEVRPDDEPTGVRSTIGSSTGSTDLASTTADADPVTVHCADGAPIAVTANVGSGDEAVRAARAGASGIGLFRTELLAFERDDGRRPSAEAQYAEYRAALDAFPDGRVAIRTFDFGGDKPGPGRPARGGDRTLESNPEGRGIARSLADPGPFREQLRAICRANATTTGDASVVLPHVTEIDQVHAARDHLEDVLSELEATGVPATRPTLTVMVETPEAVDLAPELATLVDGFAIGTNDLGAHIRGATRDSASVDGADPHLLDAVRSVVDAAADDDVSLRCCGASATDPPVAAALVGLGVDELSVPPAAVQRTIEALDGLDRSTASARADAAIESDSVPAARACLEGWSP